MKSKAKFLTSAAATAVLLGAAGVANAVVVVDYQLNDRSGATATDASASAAHGTLSGFTTTADAGDSGASGWTSSGQLRFDGSNDHVATPVASTALSGSFTVETVFTYTGPANRTWTPILGTTQNPFSGTEIFFVGKQQGTTALTMNIGGIADHAVPGTALFDGQQHHLAVVFDAAADELRTYVDGTLANTLTGRTGSFTGTGDTFLIGTSGHASGERWIGLVDRVRFSNEALAPAQFVPEPGSVTLAAVAVAGLMTRRRRRA